MTSGLLKAFPFFNFSQFSRHYWRASVSNTNKAVILRHTKSGEQLMFPTVWLRDNCSCSSCFNKDLQARLIKFKEFHFPIQPSSVSCSEKKSEEFTLDIKWPDNHESQYPLNWLKERSFEESRQKYWLQNNCWFERRTWDAETFHKNVRYFQYNEILASDEILLKYLLTLNRWGVAIIKDAGPDPSCMEHLGNRIGFLKQTTFGKLFVVSAKDDATNAGYLPITLQLHTDLPYYEYKPSCNFLHCVKQSSELDEGVNQLVDGFEVCKQLKNYDENMYNVLAKTPVEWIHTGKEEDQELHHVHRAPVICENINGDVERINFNQHQRGSQFCVSIDQANAWYKSMDVFVNLLHDPKNMIELKMEEGNILTFANVRLLHGRTAFTKSRPRTLVGGYMDWDIINSKTRVLLNKLDIRDVNEIN